MLHLYRRHTAACPHRAQTYRRCHCPIYVKGTLGGDYVRRSLDQTDWDAATALIGLWTKAGHIGALFSTARTLADAIAEYQADTRAQGLTRGTLRSHRVILARLTAWAEHEDYTRLTDLTLARLTEFRTTWHTWAPITKKVRQQQLETFLRWCVKRKYLLENPLEHITPIKVPPQPTLPFTPEEMTRILDACDWYVREKCRTIGSRRYVRAFILMLRWTGLRITDVITLPWSRVTPDGSVFLYTQKTGVAVTVPIPPEALAAWHAIPRVGQYPFWTGHGQVHYAASPWQTLLRSLFAHAGIEGGHAHRFRDTFAVEYLLAGMDITDVSVLLGHSSVRITETHYAPWVRARQSRLASSVRATWSPPAPTAD
jgi:integrase